MKMKLASDSFFIHAAEILMGAAHADGEVDGVEEDTIIGLLEGALDEDGELPDDIHNAIEEFDYEDFDLEAVAENITDEPVDIRRALLVMVATLREANGEIEAEEGLYYVRLAEALDLEVDADEFNPDDLGFPAEDEVLDEDELEIGAEM
jgi:uncharacterized tellurite resistance protein B-like protein